MLSPFRTSKPVVVIDSREQLPYSFNSGRVGSIVNALPAGDYSLEGLETDVAAVLEELLASKQVWDDQTVAERLHPQQPQIPGLKAETVNLQEYDRLLSQEVCYDPA